MSTRSAAALSVTKDANFWIVATAGEVDRETLREAWFLAFGNNDNARGFAAFLAAFDILANRRKRFFLFRNQNCFSAAADADLAGDEA